MWYHSDWLDELRMHPSDRVKMECHGSNQVIIKLQNDTKHAAKYNQTFLNLLKQTLFVVIFGDRCNHHLINPGERLLVKL